MRKKYLFITIFICLFLQQVIAHKIHKEAGDREY